MVWWLGSCKNHRTTKLPIHSTKSFPVGNDSSPIRAENMIYYVMGKSRLRSTHRSDLGECWKVSQYETIARWRVRSFGCRRFTWLILGILQLHQNCGRDRVIFLCRNSDKDKGKSVEMTMCFPSSLGSGRPCAHIFVN